jgi:hypothetical protein
VCVDVKFYILSVLQYTQGEDRNKDYNRKVTSVIGGDEYVFPYSLLTP